MKNKTDQNKHTPVLLDAVLKTLVPQEGESYLDLTAGYGGHALAILGIIKKPKLVTLIDRDQSAIDYLGTIFTKEGSELIHGDFLSASERLKRAGNKYNLILADLGLSSPHLNQASRGFSFIHPATLDMRMDESQSLSALTVVNKYPEPKLADILKEYGEEPKAKKIAKLIVQNRPVLTTDKLATIAQQAWPKHSKRHPATRTFQAIRIEVNNELNQLESALPIWAELLSPGGRLAVISFNSLEDRIIKRYFKEITGEYFDSGYKLLNNKPIKPDSDEIVINPRARSAKLRAVVKIKKKGGA